MIRPRDLCTKPTPHYLFRLQPVVLILSWWQASATNQVWFYFPPNLILHSFIIWWLSEIANNSHLALYHWLTALQNLSGNVLEWTLRNQQCWSLRMMWLCQMWLSWWLVRVDKLFYMHFSSTWRSVICYWLK